jgi:uncharacterized hydrophobic protein (TIGR00271 family)
MANTKQTIRNPEASSWRLSGIWGIRNYHTTLEQRAIAGAKISWGYVAMVLAATVMATAGLLLNSAAAIIGAMCIAPFMAPSRAVCIGALFRNWPVFFGGLLKQLFGLLIIGTAISAIITLILKHSLTDITITSEILLRAMPSEKEVVLSALIAISAGAAASLALVTQPRIVESSWGQVIDAIIGVEIAISLIPPAAVIGIGWALGTPEHSRNAFHLLLLNVVALDIIGSMAILAIRGIHVKHLKLEKKVRETVAITLDVVPGFIAVGSTVNITLVNEHEVIVDILLRREFGGAVPQDLASKIADDILEKTSCKADISIEVIPLLTYSNM